MGCECKSQTYFYAGAGADPFYTPPMDRGGPSGTFGVEVSHLATSPTLTVTVEHKNRTETSWTTAGSFAAISATGVFQKDLSGLKQQIRVATSFASGSAGDMVRIAVLPVMWRQLE